MNPSFLSCFAPLQVTSSLGSDGSKWSQTNSIEFFILRGQIIEDMQFTEFDQSNTF